MLKASSRREGRASLMSEPPSSRRDVAIDCLALGSIALLSAIPYLAGLGFYSDDWGLLAGFEAASRHGALPSLLARDFMARPVQGLYLASLFELFGLRPLGYHLVNTSVIAASVCLLYQLLVRLRLGRIPSFAAALLFVMLPQLSTVRVWYAAFQIPLSLALMLASLHLQLSFVRSGRLSAVAGAVVAALLSIAAYEIFAPLIFGFAAALAFARWGSDRTRGRKGIGIAAISLVGLVLFAFAYKIVVSGRTGAIADPNRYLAGLRQLVRPDYDWRTDSSLNLFAAARAELWEPVKGVFTGGVSLADGNTPLVVVAIAILIAAIAGWRLSVNSREDLATTGLRLFFTGSAAFILGHAVFLVVPWITFSSTGIDNRMHVAAAIGAAMIFAAAFCFAATAIPSKQRNTILGATLAVVSALAFVRLSQIERYWAEAPVLQARLLKAARADLQGLPPNSTVILDGVCPYHGPAVVFETDWDVAGALTLALHRPISGDVVSSRMKVTTLGLETSMYEEPSFYGFGNGLYVYNPLAHQLVRLTDAGVAQRYFRTREPMTCPLSFLGRGVAV